jgi:hypothetical protein
MKVNNTLAFYSTEFIDNIQGFYTIEPGLLKSVIQLIKMIFMKFVTPKSEAKHELFSTNQPQMQV